MNRTLNERARSMRIHTRLPKTFWVDAVNIAAYLINRGPSFPLDCKTLEVWSGKKVNLSFLKVFGCLSYVHIALVARSKLNPKSKKCFFSDMVAPSLIIVFWDDQNQKIIRSWDVVFNEQVLYKDK